MYKNNKNKMNLTWLKIGIKRNRNKQIASIGNPDGSITYNINGIETII